MSLGLLTTVSAGAIEAMKPAKQHRPGSRRKAMTATQRGVEPPTATHGDRIISMKETLSITGWSRGSTYRLVAAGLHPKPVKMGAWKVGFVEREICEYVANKVRGRDAAEHNSRP
jgi:prophage regulatory protein